MIGRRIFLLFRELERTLVIRHEVVRIGFEDRIEIVVRSREITFGDVEAGAAQKSRDIFGVDLEGRVELAHRRLGVAMSSRQFSLDQERLDRARIEGERLVEQLARFGRVGRR